MVKEDQTAATNTNTAAETSTDATKSTEEKLYGNAKSNLEAKEADELKNVQEKEEAAVETKGDGKEETKAEEKDYVLEVSNNSLLDKDSVDKIALYAKEHGLSKEDAETLLKSYEETLTGFEEKTKAQVADEFKKTNDLWKDSLKKDWAGDYNKNVAFAQKAAKKFLDEETMGFLDQTGLGNHPGLVKMFKKIGEQISDDEFILGKNSPPPKPKSMEEIFYGGKN